MQSRHAVHSIFFRCCANRRLYFAASWICAAGHAVRPTVIHHCVPFGDSPPCLSNNTDSQPSTHPLRIRTNPQAARFLSFPFPPQMKYFLLACLAVAVAPIAGAPQRRATACTDYDVGSTCKLVREVECVPCMFGHAALRAHADARCSRGTICVGSGAEWRRGPPARPFCHILDGLGTPSTLSLSLYRFLLARLLLVKERRALFFV